MESTDPFIKKMLPPPKPFNAKTKKLAFESVGKKFRVCTLVCYICRQLVSYEICFRAQIDDFNNDPHRVFTLYLDIFNVDCVYYLLVLYMTDVHTYTYVPSPTTTTPNPPTMYVPTYIPTLPTYISTHLPTYHMP